MCGSLYWLANAMDAGGRGPQGGGRRRWFPRPAPSSCGTASCRGCSLLLTAGLLHFAFAWALPFVIAVSLIVGLLGGRLESFLAMGRTARIETQLADAIDLMVAAVRAGAGITDALENAMRKTRSPLLPQLEEVVGRIRYGDDPRTVYLGLATSAAGDFPVVCVGAVRPGGDWRKTELTLASVGRTIRDRIEIARRIRSNSAQSEVSTLAVFLLTYFIAILVWRGNPDQMHEFLTTKTGQWTVASTISSRPSAWSGCR